MVTDTRYRHSTAVYTTAVPKMQKCTQTQINTLSVHVVLLSSRVCTVGTVCRVMHRHSARYQCSIDDVINAGPLSVYGTAASPTATAAVTYGGGGMSWRGWGSNAPLAVCRQSSCRAYRMVARSTAARCFDCPVRRGEATSLSLPPSLGMHAPAPCVWSSQLTAR